MAFPFAPFLNATKIVIQISDGKFTHWEHTWMDIEKKQDRVSYCLLRHTLRQQPESRTRVSFKVDKSTTD